MSLVFGANTTDLVDCGSGASIDGLSALTWIGWLFCTALTNSRRIVSKDSPTTTTGWHLRINGTSGAVTYVFIGGTNDLATTNTGFLTTNVWQCVAFTTDKGTSNPQVYFGDLSTAMAEATYSSQTTVVTPSSDAANSLTIGNRMDTGDSLAFTGSIAYSALFGAKLTLAQLQTWQLCPRPVIGTSRAAAFHHLGYNGVGTQKDWSGNGNHGAVTGATQGAQVPRGLWNRGLLSA